MIEIAAIYIAAKWLATCGGAYGLTRALWHTADAFAHHTDRCTNERLGGYMVRVVVDEEDEVEPEDVIGAFEERPQPEEGPLLVGNVEIAPAVRRGLVARPVRQRANFVRALVTEARAEFGAPFGSVYEKLNIKEATRIKVGDYLRKICRDRNVRKTDMAHLVDAAVDAYFVPSRRDLRRAKAYNSAIVADRQEYMDWCTRGAGPGFLGRMLMAATGVEGVKPRWFGPTGGEPATGEA